MWYTRQEQTVMTSLWYAMLGIELMVNLFSNVPSGPIRHGSAAVWALGRSGHYSPSTLPPYFGAIISRALSYEVSFQDISFELSQGSFQCL
jgi:hypothetical protein